MRILLFSSQILNALNYARAFSRLEHQFLIAILVPSGKRVEYERAAYQSEYVESPNVRFSPIFLFAPSENLKNFCNPFILIHDFVAIARTIAKFKPNAVIGMYVNHAYPLVLLKTILRFALFVIVSGGDIELYRGLIWRTIRRIVYSRSRAVFTVGERLRAEVEEESGYPASVFPTGCDTDFFRPIHKDDLRRQHGYTNEDFVITTVSQLVERKRLDDVMQACRILKDDGCRGVKAIIVGEGQERQRLKQLSSELGLTKDIDFRGFVDGATKLELLNVCDVYVIASYQEGLPFSLLEAMSCGCICICSNVGDISVVIRDGVNGFLIAARHPSILAEKIKYVMNLHKEQSLSIRHRARQTVLEKYDFMRSTRDMIEAVTKSLKIDH